MSLCPSCNAEAGDVAKFCPSCGSSIVRAPAETDYAGRIIAGKYRVEALIGEGGMGRVFRAVQMSLEKKVVLKVLHQSLLSDARTVARFQREARAASRLNHPNSISIIDFGQSEDGALYIAMEYVNGRDLHGLLSAEGPLPEARTVHIVAQVLSALAEAHAGGVIHRDLKPENIMIEKRRDDPDFVKVLDFGIAKLQESAGEEGQALTRAGFVCGTPEYMSPEQARGAQLDPRSDLYSIGVICYQCATGSLPFEADSAVGLATMHLTAEPMPPREKLAQRVKRSEAEAYISEAFEALILRAMAKDPAQRPQTAEQFRQDLLALVAGGADLVAHSSAVAPRALSRRSSRSGDDSVDEATQLSPPPTWTPADGADEQTAVEAPARPRRSTAVLFLSALAATVVVALGLLVAYDVFFKKKADDSLDLALEAPAAPSSTGGEAAGSGSRPTQAGATAAPAPTPAAPAGGAPASAGESDGGKNKRLRQGDEMLVSGKYDQALVQYLTANEDDRSAGASARIALVHLMKSDPETAQKWLKTYLERSPKNPSASYVEHYLRPR